MKDKELDASKGHHKNLAAFFSRWTKAYFGEAAEPLNHVEEISQVKVRTVNHQGATLEAQPGNRAKITFEVQLNIKGRSAGLFRDELAGLPKDEPAVKKDDVIQINHNGPEDLLGAFLQVVERKPLGVRAVSIIAKRYVRLEDGQFDVVGPAPLLTDVGSDGAPIQSHDTEPMDHQLMNGQVVHASELERPRIETAPMPHAVKRDLPKPKAKEDAEETTKAKG